MKMRRETQRRGETISERDTDRFMPPPAALPSPSLQQRVVCLGALPSGLLIVSGPFNLNGVPIKRVNQAFVIATSTKVDTTGIDISAFTDSYFARPAKKTNKGSGDFFEKQDQEAKVIDPARIAAQKAVDTKLCAAIGKVDMLRDYMRSTFTLRKGQYPHQMKF